ncbi:outer membrane lipoprotein-sorting protein [Pseudoalteromonas sp. MTN2-4]|uniref:outer membrane lipoprotein-sorting protein n=1 Tax=Pseudoalteromonas sp. MTN2-4 TaxID=3056555 RepID=UPI0036F2BAF3
MKIKKIFYAVVVSSQLLSFSVLANDIDGLSGLDIAKERKLRDTGWGDYSAKSTMILRNAHGEESIRKLSAKVLEVHGDGDKSINVFSFPKDIKGTALLSISHIATDDDQWLYLPALKRTKRISSSNKSGPFMGSEFSYEDLSSFEVEKSDYKLLRQEACGELTCYVVESYPKDKYSGYQKRISWIDSKHYRVHKTNFFDKRGSLLKTLELTDYKNYLEAYWRPHTMKMVNHQTGKSTDLLLEKVTYRNGFSDSNFSQAQLKRVF